MLATILGMSISRQRTRSPAARGGGFAHGISEVIRRRRAVILTTFVVIVAATAAVAASAPDVVALTAESGALVATLGLFFGLVAAGIGDATDARVFGARHVRGTGGDLIAVIPSEPSAPVLERILDVLESARADRIDTGAVLRVGVADASAQTHHAATWTSALAAACANRGERVLEVALASDATNTRGVVDVVRDNMPLSAATQRMSPTMQHACLNAGPNRVQALELLPELTASLPRNLDTYLVGLPLAASRPVVRAVARLDLVLVIVEVGRTTRVELIAGLDAIESVGVMTQVLLVHDGIRAGRQAAALDDVVVESAIGYGLPPAPYVPIMPVAAPPIADSNRDSNHTERIPALRRVGRVHDDEELALLRTTAQHERYVNRPQRSDGPRFP